MIRTINRSHTKAGPGRYHGQCRLIVDQGGNVLGVREPQRKFPVAQLGGNWQGLKYLSYREHDALTRERLALDSPARRIDGSIDPYLA